jgi:Gamma-glutamyltranspeptidase
MMLSFNRRIGSDNYSLGTYVDQEERDAFVRLCVPVRPHQRKHPISPMGIGRPPWLRHRLRPQAVSGARSLGWARYGMYKAKVATAHLLIAVFAGGCALAEAGPSADSCGPAVQPPFCSAVRGVRAEGWQAQSRSEVMAQHGMVVTSQPLAAQAGLQILMHGGNAIDAAVATAAVLNVVEPMMEGMGGDLFAVFYIAKEKKIYVLNASGKAPTGAMVARFNSLGYQWNPKNWGPTSGMPVNGILPVTGER